jgi:hypothetical protein
MRVSTVETGEVLIVRVKWYLAVSVDIHAELVIPAVLGSDVDHHFRIRLRRRVI